MGHVTATMLTNGRPQIVNLEEHGEKDLTFVGCGGAIHDDVIFTVTPELGDAYFIVAAYG